MIKITLGRRSEYSHVEIDGVDITGHVRGLTVSAEVGSLSEVRLVLSDTVEIEGDPGLLRVFQHDVPLLSKQ